MSLAPFSIRTLGPDDLTLMLTMFGEAFQDMPTYNSAQPGRSAVYQTWNSRGCFTLRYRNYKQDARMIVHKGTPRLDKTTSNTHGTVETARYSDAGGISQYGSYVQTLLPGARSSDRHWHEQEDEFLYVLAGQVTVTENDGEHVLGPGDAACWPAGVANAHHVSNNSDAPCSYLIVGTRVTNDICHYPDTGRTLHTEGQNWRIVDASGAILKSGHILGVPD